MKVKQYPIQNNASAQGLERRFRVTERTLHERLADPTAGNRNAEDESTEMQIMRDKMEELKGAAVKDKMSILALKDDNKKVFQKLQEFRKKYSGT